MRATRRFTEPPPSVAISVGLGNLTVGFAADGRSPAAVGDLVVFHHVSR